ncbi:MAG: high-potential iron-sulfur protein [Haloarculaceae archaeon]
MAGSDDTRRSFLRIAGAAAVAGVAGCSSDSGTDTSPTGDGSGTTGTDGGDTGEESGENEERPEGVSEQAFEQGPVPSAYRTATSQGGEARDPSTLKSKDVVRFQEAEKAVEAGLAQEGQRCENCAEFVPDENGDGYGACAKVAGYIGAEDWCSLWEGLDDSDSSEGTTEDGAGNATSTTS